MDKHMITCTSCGATEIFWGPVGQSASRNPSAFTFPEKKADPAAGPTVCKKKLVAGILALALGSLGVHNFYLGYTGKGVAQLLISMISIGTLSCISSVWAAVEGVMIFCGKITTDANGDPLV
jgi:TM2 domain-containing membrane protein YozV